MHQRSLRLIVAGLAALALFAAGWLGEGALRAPARATPAPPAGAPTPAPRAVGPTISRAQAARAAVAYRHGGAAVAVELDEEHGARVYAVRLGDGSMLYVDAVSGQVVYARSPAADD